MGAYKALTLAGALVLSGASLASAADLLPPPPIIEAPAPPPVDTSGWYLRADVGVGVNGHHDPRSEFNSTNAYGSSPPAVQNIYSSIDDGALIGGGIGYQYNSWLRGDFTAEYRAGVNLRRSLAYWDGGYDGASNSWVADNYTSRLRTGLYLFNGYIDLGTWYGVTPYVGAGVGLADHHWSGVFDQGRGWGYSNDRYITNFAWAFNAGLSFNITPNVKMDLSYRHVDMGKLRSESISCAQADSCFGERHRFRNEANDFRLGFRYLFVSAPPIMQGPLIRKY